MDRITTVVAMYQTGATVEQIAATCEVTKKMVYRDLHVARLRGLLPRRAESIRRDYPMSGYAYAQRICKPSRVGSMRDLTQHLTPEVLKWLAKMTTPDGTLADVVRSIVIDAFHDGK